jgi:energy-converting hydrogenase A subunit M
MKTAVEWLEEQIKWRTDITDIIAKAKEMEKEHIKNAFNEGYTQCSIEDLKPTSRKRYEDAEQYYKETFKSQ